MIKIFRFSIFLIFAPLLVNGQQKVLQDQIFLDNIHSISFNIDGLVTSIPILELNGTGRLALGFDDLLGGDAEYRYEVVHCDKDWKPSNLESIEYIDGFNDEELDDYIYSQGTYVNYTHYNLYLPNDDMQLTKSGNYVIKMYENEGKRLLAFTKRFMVVDQQVRPFLKILPFNSVDLLQEQQGMQVDLDLLNFNVASPFSELFVSVLQNGRFDNAKNNLEPRNFRGSVLNFEDAHRIGFPGLKEMRFMDIRNIKTRGIGIESIEISNSGIWAFHEIDDVRNGDLYFSEDDLNGKFILGSNEYGQYCNVVFTLDTRREYFDTDIYVVGEFNNWQVREENKLVYDSNHRVYTGQAFLKQGRYDYLYTAVVNGERDDTFIEGSSFKTRNFYTALVYYRPTGGRYDQLIGVFSTESSY